MKNQNSSEMSGISENQEKCGWVKFSESKLVSLEKKILQGILQIKVSISKNCIYLCLIYL